MQFYVYDGETIDIMNHLKLWYNEYYDWCMDFTNIRLYTVDDEHIYIGYRLRKIYVEYNNELDAAFHHLRWGQ